jgi:mRNA-degrading endonuclease HigB of HigAB toxin-antitoxin module
VNEAPTNISLSNNTVAENEPVNTVVGTLSTSDPDVGDTHTYTLVSGDGSTDNASFNISGNSLRTSAVFDYETKNSYAIRIRSTDAGGLYFEKAFTINVTNVNEAPTNISLSNNTVAENEPVNTVVGTLSTSDPDVGDTHTYTLVSGDGSTDNASFNILGNSLRTSAVFNYETKNSYTIRIRSTDAGGLYFEKAFTINVTNVNEAPTNISLSNNTVAENAAVNTVVGTLSTSDPDVGDTHTYTLVSGDGSTDNASFNISGNSLRTSAVFDYETKNSYAIRIRSTDAGGLYFEKAFTINVTNVNEAPTNISLSNNTVAENEPVNTVVGTLSTSDPDVGDTHTYTLVSGDGSTDNASFNISGNSLRTSAVFNYETKNSYTIRIRSTDAGGLYFEKAFTILVTGVNKPPIAVDDAYQTDMNQALIVGAPGILANDSDPDGDPLSAIIDIGTSNGTLNLSLNGAFTYTPNSGFSGVDQFTYMANDGEFSSNIATVTITVVDTNQAPTNISLSNNTVAENAAVNTVVGTLSTSDPDVGDTHTYTLVSGEGSTDNASFNISENSLRTSAVFNYETKNSYTIRVRSTDAGGLYFEKVFTIIVSKVDTGYTFFLPLIFK